MGISRRRIGFAVLAGLLLRLACLWLVAYPQDSGDTAEYDAYAVNLVRHHVFSDAAQDPTPSLLRPPGYPMLLAGVYSLAGERHHLPVQLIQIALSLLAALMLALGVGRLVPKLGEWVLWIGMLSPWDAIFTGLVTADSPSGSFLVMAMSAPLLWRGWRGWFGAGVAFALSLLCRDVYSALVLAVVIGLVAGLPDRFLRRPVAPLPRRLGAAGALLAGTLLLVLPWSFRNLRVSGHFVLTTKGLLGQALWTGTWETNADWFNRHWEVNLSPDSCRTPAECAEVKHAFQDLPMGPEREKILWRLTLDRYRSEPMRVLGRWLLRVPQMWRGSRIDIFAFRPAWLAYGKPIWFLLKVALTLGNLGCALLGFAGIVMAFFRRHPLFWLAIPVFYTMGVFLPMHSTESRYSGPVFPLVMVLAAWTVLELLQRRRAGLNSPAGVVENVKPPGRMSS